MSEDTHYAISKREAFEILSGIVEDCSARINQLKAEQKAIFENAKGDIRAIVDKYPDYNLHITLDESLLPKDERAGLPYEDQPDLDFWGASWESPDDDTDEPHTH